VDAILFLLFETACRQAALKIRSQKLPGKVARQHGFAVIELLSSHRQSSISSLAFEADQVAPSYYLSEAPCHDALKRAWRTGKNPRSGD
jgi:hypothetical protein